MRCSNLSAPCPPLGQVDQIIRALDPSNVSFTKTGVSPSPAFAKPPAGGAHPRVKFRWWARPSNKIVRPSHLESSVASFTRWALPPESSVEDWPSSHTPGSRRTGWSLFLIFGRAEKNSVASPPSCPAPGMFCPYSEPPASRLYARPCTPRRDENPVGSASQF